MDDNRAPTIELKKMSIQISFYNTGILCLYCLEHPVSGRCNGVTCGRPHCRKKHKKFLRQLNIDTKQDYLHIIRARTRLYQAKKRYERGPKICTLADCKNEIPIGRYKYCSEKCADNAMRERSDLYNHRQKINRSFEMRIDMESRRCARTACNRPIASSASLAQIYCSSNCAMSFHRYKNDSRRGLENESIIIAGSKKCLIDDCCNLIPTDRFGNSISFSERYPKGKIVYKSYCCYDCSRKPYRIMRRVSTCKNPECGNQISLDQHFNRVFCSNICKAKMRRITNSNGAEGSIDICINDSISIGKLLQCVYCGDLTHQSSRDCLASDKSSLDHIDSNLKYTSQDGPINWVLACNSCNSSKGTQNIFEWIRKGGNKQKPTRPLAEILYDLRTMKKRIPTSPAKSARAR